MRFPDLGALWDRGVAGARRRSPRIDHLWRSLERFNNVHASRLSAAISYYAFFAAFSMSLLAVAVLGYLLEFESLAEEVEKWLSNNLPIIDINDIEASRQTVGLVALGALILAGVAWVQSVRSSIRAVWLLEQQPGNPILRWLLDLMVLTGLGILLILTVSVSAMADIGLEKLGVVQGDDLMGRVFALASLLLGLLVNTVLATALLSGLPRLALPFDRVVPPAIWVALGLELLKTVGRVYIANAADRPAYQAVATAVGFLVFLYIFNLMLLFAASWTATSRRGRAIDLADRAHIENE